METYTKLESGVIQNVKHYNYLGEVICENGIDVKDILKLKKDKIYLKQ